MIERLLLEWPGGERELTVEALSDGRYRIVQGDRALIFDARKLNGQSWSLLPEGGGRAFVVDLDGALPEVTAATAGVSLRIKVTDPRQKVIAKAVRSVASGPIAVKSPMPGKIVKVLVAVGAEVKAGQGLVVVEAMKMENELKAPRDGRIKTLSAAEGQPVEAGETLATIE